MDNEAMRGKRRGWIKNAAIIFLAVMLVLTFFSQTIMNRSLPEVATQYVAPGSISARIRGTGTVTANSAYEVKIRENRVIKTVTVRRGDTVEAGDVLFLLEEGESADTKELRDQLETARYNYRVMLLNSPYVNASTENRTIQRLREALQDAIDERDLAYVTDEEIAVAESGVVDREIAAERKADDLEDLEEEIAEVEDQIKAAGGSISDGDTGDGSGTSGTNLNEALDQADIARRTAYIQYARILRNLYYLTYRAEIKESAYPYTTRLAQIDRYFLSTYGSIYQGEISEGEDRDPQRFDLIRDGAYFYNWFDKDEIAHLQAYAGSSGAIDIEIPNAENTGKNNSKDSEDDDDGDSSGSYESSYSNPYLTALSAIQGAEATYEKAQKALADAQASYIEGQMSSAEAAQSAAQIAALKARLAELNDEKKALDKEKKRVDADLEDAKALLETLKTRKDSYKTLEGAVKSAEDALEDGIASLQDSRHTATVERQKYDLDLEKARQEIHELEEKIEKAGSEEQSDSITAPVSGTVTAINISAGSTTEYDVSLMTIEESDRGYMVAIPVTNEQAQKVRIGDRAEPSGYYWGPSYTATLAAITNDPSNPGQGKLLNFTVEGEISAGEQLSLAIGERSANYELVVPNSAVRSDANGSFVLTVQSKSSPLGNRYVATRVDVQVLAKDDTNTAISGGLVSYDYVITTASAPVNPGQLVRLASN